eukprot:jgi/Tetstr1/459275/TSEL_004675.t1
MEINGPGEQQKAAVGAAVDAPRGGKTQLPKIRTAIAPEQIAGTILPLVARPRPTAGQRPQRREEQAPQETISTAIMNINRPEEHQAVEVGATIDAPRSGRAKPLKTPATIAAKNFTYTRLPPPVRRLLRVSSRQSRQPPIDLPLDTDYATQVAMLFSSLAIRNRATGVDPRRSRVFQNPIRALGPKLGDVGFGPHAPWLDEPSLAKQSDSADLPVGQMYLVVGLLIQGEHSVTPSLYELVDDIKHAGDNGPMAVTHTNAEWLAMIETWRFRDLLRRASIKLMNVIDTAKGRETIQLLTPDEPAKNWGKYLSDHIIDWDVQDKVSDEQAAARLDAITKFRAKVDDLGPTCFPRKFQDLFKEHIAATNTTIRSEAYRIKNQMPDLVISFFTKFALLACAPELIAVSAPNVSNELWISMKAEELPVMPKGEGVDKDDKVWLNTELCKTCIVEGNFKAPATKQFVADAMSAVRARKATVFIADALFGAGSHTWDSKDAAWGTDDFNDVFAFARQDNPHNPGA